MVLNVDKLGLIGSSGSKTDLNAVCFQGHFKVKSSTDNSRYYKIFLLVCNNM